jgi:hypothetical protein
MSVSALFDIGGYNGTGIVGLNSSLLWHPKTIEEIEKAGVTFTKKASAFLIGNLCRSPTA